MRYGRGLLGLGLALCALPAAGQDPTNGWLTAGTPVNSAFYESEELESWDDVSNLRCDEFAYRGTRNERIRVTLRSSDFDAWLLVGYLRDDDSIDGIVNDDMPGSLNAQVDFLIDESHGIVWVIACARFSGTGAFTLTLERLPAGRGGGGGGGGAAARPPSGLERVTGSPPVPVSPINSWIERNGDHNSILTSGEALETWGRWTDLRCDDVGYQARPGERFEVRLAATEFDAWLLVGYRNDDGSITGSINDDADGLDSRVVFQADQTGRPVRIHACARNSGIRSGMGTYQLTVRTLQ